MLESLLAVAVTAVAGGALLTSLSSSIQSSSAAADTLVAQGLAEQLMDEVTSVRFSDGTDPIMVGLELPGSAGSSRSAFDDIDDYAGWSSRPPVTREGRPLGTQGTDGAGQYFSRPAELRPDAAYLARLTREVIVERVVLDADGNWATTFDESNYRRVTVRVRAAGANSQTRRLAELTRILSNVPVSP